MTQATAQFINVGERTNVTGSAKFKRLILDGDYEDIDIIDELTADGEVEETNIITDSQYLVNHWKQCVVECDEYGVPTE